jgi:metal-responsive CopG/Arc/MetJ family transcriptional regulator
MYKNIDMNSLHISIQEDLHDELLELAKSQKSSKTEIIRRALEAYIRTHQRQKTHQDMKRYAQEMAEHSGEFVKETDKAVTKQLLAATEW